MDTNCHVCGSQDTTDTDCERICNEPDCGAILDFSEAWANRLGVS